jgi:hypothetical protein
MVSKKNGSPRGCCAIPLQTLRAAQTHGRFIHASAWKSWTLSRYRQALPLFARSMRDDDDALVTGGPQQAIHRRRVGSNAWCHMTAISLELQQTKGPK